MVIVAVPPAIKLTPSSGVSFSVQKGGAAPGSLSMQVENTGGGDLKWTASENASWLSLSPTTGTAPSSITLLVNPSGLDVGTYTTSVVVAGSGASNSPQTMPVTLNVNTDCVAPSAITSSASPLGQTSISVLGSFQTGGCPTTVWAEVGYTQVFPGETQSGTISLPATPTSTTATFEVTGLLPATSYWVRAVAQNEKGTASASPILVTTQSPAPPTLYVSPTETARSYNTSVFTVATDSLQVTVANVGGGTMSWTASDNVGWIALRRTSGSVGAGSSETFWAVFSWTIQKGVEERGEITITAPGAVGSPKVVVVRMSGF